jgi:adenylyltransferase/sulfurtransferase
VWRLAGRLALVASGVAAAAMPLGATHSLGPMPPVPAVSAQDVKELLAAGAPFTLIDVRPAGEYEVSRLPGARSVPLSELRRRYTEIPRAGLVVVYCACRPGESWHAHELLQVRGYRNIVVLAEGFSGWAERGYPLERG